MSLTQLVVVETVLKGFVLVDVFDVGGEMAEDFEREVTEGLLGALDPLAGVRLSKGDAQVFTCGLELSGFLRLGDVGLSDLGERLEVFDALLEIGIVDTGLEAELVLHGAGEGVDQVESRAVTSLVRFRKGVDETLTFWRVDPPFRGRHRARQRGPRRYARSSGLPIVIATSTCGPRCNARTRMKFGRRWQDRRRNQGR